MEYPFKDEPPPELLERAARERPEYPSAEIRPFVRELAARGGVTPAEFAVPMNSYERHLLEPVLETELLAGHMEYCAANCRHAFSHPGGCPASYDDALAMVLVPAAARRLRLLHEKLGSFGDVCFAVEVCDDHDGGSVWISDEEFLETREEAEELAAKRSLQRDNGIARVVEVRRRIDSFFREGTKDGAT